MTYLTACLVIAAAVAAASGASLLIGRLTSVELRERHHALGSHVFALVGVMFSVLLAFVFSEVWGEYNAAAQAINQECGALHGAAILASTLPAGRPLNQAIVAYGQAVSTQEWPAMARRRESPPTRQALRLAIDRAARMQTPAPTDLALRGQIVSLLADAHTARETRTFEVTQALPAAMWAVLIVIATMLDLYVLFAGAKGVGHALFACAFTGATVMVLVLVRMLDHPFEGALALPSGDFLKMTAETAAMLAGG